MRASGKWPCDLAFRFGIANSLRLQSLQFNISHDILESTRSEGNRAGNLQCVALEGRPTVEFTKILNAYGRLPVR
jgi:hypothetical protein